MENQRVSLLRQKNRWGWTALSVMLCLLLSPLMATVVLMPQIMAFFPVAVLFLLGYVGPVSAVACLSIVVAMCTLLFGLPGAVCAVLFLMPVMIASSKTAGDGVPFWQSVGVSTLTLFLSVCALLAVLTYLAGTDVVTALSDNLRAMFASAGAAFDPMLEMFVSSGIVAAPEGVNFAALSDEVRADLVKAIVFAMDGALRLELPAQIATGSLIAGLFGQALLRTGMLRRGLDTPYVPMREWRVPRGWGSVLGVTFAALLIASYIAPEQFENMFYVFGCVFDRVFVIQGVAALWWMLYKRGKGGFLKGLVFVLGYVMMGSVTIFIGIADQAMDIVRRRKELEPLTQEPAA